MRGFIGLTKRNLLIYFKDVQAVIFSLLTSIIVFALYLLFLKGTFTDAINGAMQGLQHIVTESDVEMIANAILLTGILGSAMITVPFNCLQTIVKDREQKIDYDISATPLKRGQIVLSYFLASTISASFLTGIILTVGLLILSAMGGICLTVSSLAAAYGIVLLGSVSATAFFMIVVQFFSSSAASGAFFGILSAAAGFVIGAYIPISQFSESVQTFCNLFPASHATILLRNALMNDLLADIDKTIGGIDNGMFVETIKEQFSFRANMFGASFAEPDMVCYIAGVAVACVLVMIVLYSKTYKRK